MDLQKTGERIRAQRESRGFTQQEVAQHLNCSLKRFIAFENGESILPVRYLKMLSTLLDVSADYILCLSDTPDLICESLADSPVTQVNAPAEEFSSFNFQNGKLKK